MERRGGKPGGGRGEGERETWTRAWGSEEGEEGQQQQKTQKGPSFSAALLPMVEAA